MKHFLLVFIISVAFTGITAQNRFMTRGEYGELYVSDLWYGIYNPAWGPPFYDTLRNAVFRITENGKKLTVQYDADYFCNPETTMNPFFILADATPGVVYMKMLYSKNSYEHTALWVSFDYGKNWEFREENIGSKYYYPANFEGLIYRGGGGGFPKVAIMPIHGT